LICQRLKISRTSSFFLFLGTETISHRPEQQKTNNEHWLKEEVLMNKITEFSQVAAGRGFASMAAEKQREIARKGGKAAHEKGTAHEFTSEEARAAGRKGGETVSRNREHMSAIGHKGGLQSAGGRRQKEQALLEFQPGA
jgi:uncharacterized protein